MANIFQQTLTDIPVQGYKPTEQKNTAVADTITAVGNTLLEADAARERVLLEGRSSDEVPMMDKWTSEEMAGPYRPGEPPIFRAKHEEVFDASADLNLSQIAKARKQGLITPGEAEVRINSALRQAINRRPGRQAELVQTANEYLGVYSGITQETEAEKAAKEAADMNQKLEYHFRTKFGLGREAGEKWQLQLTMDEMRARSEQGLATTQPTEFARLDQQVAYQMLANVMNLPEQDRPEAILAIKTFLDGKAVERHGMIGSTYLDKGLRESAIAEYDKSMARVYERAGDVDFMTLSARRNNELSQAGLGHIYAALGPEMAVLAEKFPERAVDQITRIMISYDKIAKDKKFEKNPEMLDEVLWNEAIKNGHFGIMAYKLRGMPESVWGRAMLKGKEEVQKGIRSGHRPPSLSTLEYGTGAADQMVYDKEMGEDPYPAGLAFLNNAVDDPMSYVYALNPEKKAIIDGDPRLKEKLIRSLTVSYQALVSQLGHSPTEPNLVQKIFDLTGSMAARSIEIEKLKAVVKTAKEFGVDLEALSGAPDNNSVSKKNSEGNAMSTDINKLYTAVASAETGGQPDPFIRTKVTTAKGGSSAYGPVQITKSLASNMLRKYPDAFDAEEKAYLAKFIEQGNTFLKYGNEPWREGYDPKYDYGGAGVLNSAEDRAMYEQVAKKFMQIELDAVSGDVDKFIRRWRGADPEKWYASKIKKGMEEVV